MTGSGSESLAGVPLPPGAELLTLLRQTLAAYLKVAEEQIDDSQSLDELGIDSIDAVLLSGELADRLNIDLAPEFLLKYRTLDEVLRGLLEVRGEVEPAASAASTPMFFFPGGGGRESAAARLMQDCDARLSLEIVPLGEWQHWMDGGCELVPLLDRCCDWIEARFPRGTLRLAGYSLGGQIAFAVALSLMKRGRTVGGLYLFNSSAEPPKKAMIRLRGFVERNLARVWTNAASIPRRTAPAGAPEEMAERHEMIGSTGILKAAAEALELPLARSLLLRWAIQRPRTFADRRSVRVDNAIRMKLLDMMWRRWAAHLSPAETAELPVTLFRAQSPGSADLGWSAFCRDLRVIPVKGDHGSMVRYPLVRDLVAKFLVAIDSDSQSGAPLTTAPSGL